jgi:MFS superfamily sulfate permease-like transporter
MRFGPRFAACFMLAAVETTAIGRMFGAKNGYRLDATQEFLAIGSANLLAGLGSGLPVSGGMSQSLVNETGGARTPLSGLIAALITLVVVLFFTDLLRDLPQPVLAAVVLMAVTGLIQIEALRSIWRFSRKEFAVAMAALLGVLGAGLLQGVLIGVVISLLLLIGRAMRGVVDFRAQPSLKPEEVKYGWSGAATSNFHTPFSSFAALFGYIPSENPRDSGAASMCRRRWRIFAEVPSGATSITGWISQ